tara:strand:+ start:451 stop:1395 length:945 start_codon:yes stop_codon:yes gene_type:complete
MNNRIKNVDNIYATFDSTRHFKKIFNQSRKSTLVGLTATKDNSDPFKDILKIFFPNFQNKILVRKKLKKLGYDLENNIEADYFIEDLGLIFEFDGPPHYSNPFKIVADNRKYKCTENIKKKGKKIDIRIIRIPYYFQLTKDVAKFLFKDLIKHFSKILKNLSSNGYYTDDKFNAAIKKTYFNLFSGKGAQNDCEILACGLHRSREVPSVFCEAGIEKLLKDFKFYRSLNDTEEIVTPKSIEHQYMWSLKYYIDDVKTYDNEIQNKKLILPTWHKEFMNRYEKNINNKDEKLLDCVFLRDYKSVIKTKNSNLKIK